MLSNFRIFTAIFEPCHEVMVLFVLSKILLQTRMRSHPVRLDVWFLIGPFVYFHTSCVQTAKALARLHGCTGLPDPSLVAYVINTKVSCAGSIDLCLAILSNFRELTAIFGFLR